MYHTRQLIIKALNTIFGSKRILRDEGADHLSVPSPPQDAQSKDEYSTEEKFKSGK